MGLYDLHGRRLCGLWQLNLNESKDIYNHTFQFAGFRLESPNQRIALVNDNLYFYLT